MRAAGTASLLLAVLFFSAIRTMLSPAWNSSQLPSSLIFAPVEAPHCSRVHTVEMTEAAAKGATPVVLLARVDVGVGSLERMRRQQLFHVGSITPRVYARTPVRRGLVSLDVADGCPFPPSRGDAGSGGSMKSTMV